MHPEIRRPGPGSCRSVGWPWEPVTVTADAGPSPELADMTRRFWVATALTIPIVILEMGRHFVPWLHDLIPATASVWRNCYRPPGRALGRVAFFDARLGLGPDPTSTCSP